MKKNILSTLSIALLLSTPFALNAGKKKKNHRSILVATQITSHDGSQDDMVTPPSEITLHGDSSSSLSSHTAETAPAVDELASLGAEGNAERKALLGFMAQACSLTAQNSLLRKELAARGNPDDVIATVDAASGDHGSVLVPVTTIAATAAETAALAPVAAQISTAAWLASFVYTPKK